MSDLIRVPAAPQGIMLESDVSAALRYRKIALATGAIVRSFPDYQTIAEEVVREVPDFLLIDCCDRSGDALSFIHDMRRDAPDVAILAILPEGADELSRRAVIGAGVRDFFVKPFGIDEFQMRLRNVMGLKRAGIEDSVSRSVHEDEIRNAIGEILIREYETLHVLGKAAEYKDQETGTHIVRVAHYARLISEMIGETDADQDSIYHSSALHDIGKIGIPDQILLKPGGLSDREYRVMQTHTTNGHGILERSESSYLLNGAMIALTHHERYDGSGYPMGLAGNEIPLHGRIVCVADVFDALTTKRPYKEPWSLDRAFDLIQSERGTQFDPLLVDAFASNAPRVREIYYENRDPEDIPTVDPAVSG